MCWVLVVCEVSKGKCLEGTQVAMEHIAWDVVLALGEYKSMHLCVKVRTLES